MMYHQARHSWICDMGEAPLIGDGRTLSVPANWQGTDFWRSRHQGLYDRGVSFRGLLTQGGNSIKSARCSVRYMSPERFALGSAIL